jgi:hypothetical protein
MVGLSSGIGQIPGFEFEIGLRADIKFEPTPGLAQNPVFGARIPLPLSNG